MIAEKLAEAKALITPIEHWCQGADARDVRGYNVVRGNPAACKWCAYGAIYRVAEEFPERDKLFNYLEQAAQHLYDNCAVGVNDGLGHEATLKMFDEAIALANRKEGVNT